MDAAGVPAGRITNVKDLMESEHLRERGAVEKIRVAHAGHEDGGWDVEVPRVAPLLEGIPGTRWAGPDLGQHNEEIFMGHLGLSVEELEALRDAGVVGK